MSCEDCDKIQRENKEGHNVAYLRVGTGNVVIGACDFHFNELRRNLRLPTADTVVLRMK